MKLFHRAASVVAAALLGTGAIAPVVQSQPDQTVTLDHQEAYIQEFHRGGDRPPIVDGVGGYSDEEVAQIHEAIRQAYVSGEPHDELVPGEMWSDKIDLPATIDKAAADEAEIKIAQQQSGSQARALAAQCQFFWPSPYQVCGAILERYNQQGGPLSWMLLPIENQALNPDGQGYRQRFMSGFIYWHPTTGAHAVNNYSAQIWERHGWESGWMGYPIGGEVPVSGSNLIDGEINGWVQTFQGGRVYRTPMLEGFQIASINGMILNRWLAIGGPDSALGFPIADEAVASDGVGRFSVFQNGVLYWHPNHGAWEMTGFIEEVWKMRGGLDSQWGYPTSAPVLDSDAPVEIAQNFSGGVFDLATEIEDAGFSPIEDKEMSNLILEYFGYLGFDFPGSSSRELVQDHSKSDLMTLRASRCALKDSSQASFGGVTIPSHYDYWGCLDKSDRPDPDAYGRHDYCTLSPDSYGPLGKKAEFSGACARHDLCMDAVDANGTGYAPCHPAFYTWMSTVCTTNYAEDANFKKGCVNTAKAYYKAVQLKNPN
ncbi:putative secreted protein [Corynebacterium glutamicum MB001]|uniref:Uncharacterized protein n=1 Tax=Corynebacterium glutamicum (strain ATCC 13032 / DSM 20300 / JCM 1318 / BCRC 11384 / CCUG 27702 / LMG 3730 / NBRC 12168 / NCIMB 10025 / NRRL B-2784 / 534) TaxID=196627 RepID=Q8NMM5_CORGL|nr:LGFP repeat-containing protein [Corynebacterium glutamicum]AGT06264.1 putative secreted protein [Corynebacterium glutamicum MB001]AIK84988.1 hypothetical protein CGLAR1_06915 [Corynebacterium glutamicum]AIK87772.1 hypothetical protein AR0_07050 [Corynebacterium glutamicum]ALZ99201.1 hypothetical protein APT58_02585 [Corynebacterium glutamicum]ARV63446.1 hypothetical protein B7P23_00330 [Corynebacterium glutamicum]